MAGMLGIEPRSTVLETAILTVVLHPLMYLYYFITFFAVCKDDFYINKKDYERILLAIVIINAKCRALNAKSGCDKLGFMGMR